MSVRAHCTPASGKWGLFLLTKLPGLALWGCLLLLIWQLIREANTSGPFTPRVAATADDSCNL